jgi:hypothetical protein
LISVLSLLGVRGGAWGQSTSVARAPNPGGSYRIAGVVVSKSDGNPLARARITVREVKNPDKLESMVTAEDGKFEFTGVPAGKYSLRGAKRGFITAAYDQHDEHSTAIVTGAGIDTENLVLKLSPDALISGVVLDEAGDPVRNAMVTLYVENHAEGMNQIGTSRGTQTDDLGAFELTDLTSGTYFVAVSAKPWYAVHTPSVLGQSGSKDESTPPTAVDRSLDVAYPVTYFGDVTDADSATPIVIRGGERIRLEVHLNPVPSLRLLFRMPNDGRAGFSPPRIEMPTFDGVTNVQTSFTSCAPGICEVTGIPAGRYNVQFMGMGSNPGKQILGVNLTKDGEELDASTAQAVSSVTVSVQATGEAAVPKGVTIGLRAQSRSRDSWRRIDSKGAAEFQQISPGKYEVVAVSSGGRYVVANVSADGAEVSGHTVTVGAGASLSLTVSLISGSADLQGTVKKAGKPFAGAMVVLVPQNPAENHDLFRRDQSDLDGTFVLRGAVRGSYTVVAIENGWDLHWAEPDVIADYAKHGRRVRVGSEAARSVNLDDIEVQPR